MDLNTLTIFDSVAASGSFTRAADKLGVAKAKISVSIGRLERDLGVALFTRTTRQVQMTDAGRALHAECAPLLRALNDALSGVGSATGELTGSLRISAATAHASESVGPAVAKFAALHPALQVELRTADRVSDMVAEGIDLSFRMGWLRDSSQRAIKLGEFRQFVVTSPAYLKAKGRPTKPVQLAAHEWVALTLLQSPHTWTFTAKDGRQQTVHMRSRLQTDSPSTLLAMVEHGAGITVMDETTLKSGLAAGTLVKLLPSWTLPVGGIYAVLPPGRHVPPAVRAFIDFYRDLLGA